MKRDQTFLIRVSAEDIQRAEAYRVKNGLRSSSDSFREALKTECDRQGIALPQPEASKPAPPKKKR